MVYPYLVTLSAVRRSGGSTRRTTCVGSVIGHNRTGAVVLTVAHFFDTVSAADTRLKLEATGTYRRAMSVDKLAGTDLALVTTNAKFSADPHPYYPPLSPARLRPLTRVLTVAREPIPGTVITPVVVGLGTHMRIRVRTGALVAPDPGRKVHLGDSGSPVLADGRIVGVQSLVFNPCRVNTGLSTIACVRPHLARIAHAVS
ncbi:trypsin-like serine protease [Corynebacterium glucuronolyticum]|uniref:Trypsin-like serine protease n=2 Tax=Corynebacteriaceae TaxID=1653 RepID=A0A7T4EE92_9CORY|nr:trypsin-like serine protease [Corynebacterium glucuronolyticum]QQU89685.1 trypsin-like serine protease [Corynebacterium glucuronolyticum]QRO83272.1 trypsin-like serine protease [Corynebacterium glucuronolyticum]QRP71852.1 trypsin-like serine protease [Corynebacterium glucuronolyticum]